MAVLTALKMLAKRHEFLGEQITELENIMHLHSADSAILPAITICVSW